MKRPRKPTPDEMMTAWAWLKVRPSGPEGSEAEECLVVANWLQALAEAEALRKIAREHNVPLLTLRKEMREQLTPYRGI